MIVETLYLSRVINCVLYHFYPANSKKVTSWEGVIAKQALKKNLEGVFVERWKEKKNERHTRRSLWDRMEQR